MKFFCFFCFILSACNSPSSNTNTTFKARTSVPSSHKIAQEKIANSNVKVTYKIVNAIDNTFGYDILVDEKIFIHQPTIPAAVGNQGFTNKKDAQKVAELVTHKIKQGEMPPNVSIEEIKKLNLTKNYKIN
jgi:hypothetical protein